MVLGVWGLRLSPPQMTMLFMLKTMTRMTNDEVSIKQIIFAVQEHHGRMHAAQISEKPRKRLATPNLAIYN